MRVVAVTGASSSLALKLITLLDQDPHVERIVAIDAQPPAIETAKVKFFEADINGPVRSGLEKFVVTHVVHLAVTLDDTVPDATSRRVNVGGTSSLLTACVAVPSIESVVVPSTVSVYGPNFGNSALLVEDAVFQPTKFPLSLQFAEIEALCATYRQRFSPLRVSVARFASVIGWDANQLMARAFHQPPALRHTKLPLQVVHVDDAARALHALVASDANKIYNVVCDGSVTFFDAWQALGVNSSGKNLLRKILPTAASRNFSREAVSLLDAWPYVDNRSFKTDLKFEYRFDAQQVLQTLIS